ncbi:hypothetical protein CRG98_037594 [Punica granatum]|uniref:Uncharacterized protein n=1 Tax=Punica granatum TaxID=22663 RepID=A0A2I0IF85_PUNGR|nr:hypothetical protein CRG98_037594 [Punica granatum]
MCEEKSRGSDLDSRKTRLGRNGLRDPRGSSRGSPGKTSRHASSGHGTANPVKNKRMVRRLSTVERLSDRDHLFTGESEGCEEPFERDGTTHRSRGKKWHVGRLGVRG